MITACVFGLGEAYFLASDLHLAWRWQTNRSRCRARDSKARVPSSKCQAYTRPFHDDRQLAKDARGKSTSSNTPRGVGAGGNSSVSVSLSTGVTTTSEGVAEGIAR